MPDSAGLQPSGGEPARPKGGEQHFASTASAYQSKMRTTPAQGRSGLLVLDFQQRLGLEEVDAALNQGQVLLHAAHFLDLLF